MPTQNPTTNCNKYDDMKKIMVAINTPIIQEIAKGGNSTLNSSM